MFLGTFTPRLDDKGRLTLPAKFRALLEEDVVLTKGQENCIAVYPRSEFTKIVGKVHAAARDENNRILLRQMSSAADEQQVDGQGRITIPARHRRYANLDRDCAVNGLVSYFEIWDLASWQRYDASTEDIYSKARESDFTGLL